MVLFSIVYKHYIFFHLQHSKTKKSSTIIGTAEKKMLLVFVYYILVGAIALSTFTLSIKYVDYNTTETFNYFDCQKSGFNNTCEFNTKQFSAISIATYVLLAILPSINLVYALNIKEIKSGLKGVCSQLRNRV